MTRSVPRGMIALSLIVSAVLAIQLARLTVYMIDPAATGGSVMPWNPFGTRHSCFTGYWAAAQAIDTTPNVWSDDLTSVPGPTPGTRVPKSIGPFSIDSYEYTPTFLLLPRAVMRLTPDFVAARFVWYIVNVVIVVAAIVAVARRLQPALGPAVLWLAPVVLVPLSVLVTFQIGNIQLACIAGSVLAMLWLERPRAGQPPTWMIAAGACLLAYMTVSKLYPGMLVLYLLMRREGRAVGWTAAFSALFVLVGFLQFGVPAHLAFLDHLPRLLSGESFPNLRNPNGISANVSVPGVVRKLSIYGLPFSDFAAMRVVGWVYTILLVAWVARVATTSRSAALEPVVWISIVLLATFRSPVLPQYGIFPTVWLLAVVLAARWADARIRVTLLAWFAVLAVVTPAWTLWPPTVHAVFTTVVETAGSIALAIAAVRLAASYPALPEPAPSIPR